MASNVIHRQVYTLPFVDFLASLSDVLASPEIHLQWKLCTSVASKNSTT